MSVKVLDCTLRDGAYVVDGEFGDENIAVIKTTLDKANIDIIECGWLRDCKHKKDSVFYNIPEDMSGIIRKNKYSLMFDYGRYDISKLPQNTGSVDIIRMAFYKKSLDEISFAAEKVKSKGYEVFLQPSNVKEYTKTELEKLCKRANYIGVNACYIVDSFGSLFPEDLEKIIPIFSENLEENILLGFHSHNNIQLSLALSIQFINTVKRDIVVDSTLCGIGRGGGNTKTELLIEYLNRFKESKYDIRAINELAKNTIEPLGYCWEYTLEKGQKGLNNLHP